MLFRYQLRCSHCGKLMSKFTLPAHAHKAALAHIESYKGLFGEADHIVTVTDLQKKGGDLNYEPKQDG